MDTASSSVVELQGILQEILNGYDEERISKLSESALGLIEGLSPFGDVGDRGVAVKLQGSGIGLWNKAVALKSAGEISPRLNAQLRYISSNLMVLTTPTNGSVEHLEKQITMSSKTGKAWLECGNCTMAERALTIAGEYYERVRSEFPMKAKEHSLLKKFLLLLCYKVEAALGLSQYEAASGFLEPIKELLHTLETEVMYVCMLCYNFGLDMYHRAEYQHSVSWLKQSYEIGRGNPSVDGVRQARTLRLLANTFLEWDGSANWQKALSAVGLANSEHSHASGLLLKTSILLQYDPTSEAISQAFDDTLHHPDLSLDIALATITKASQHNRVDLSFTGIAYLAQRYRSTPSLVQVHMLHLDLLLKSKKEIKAMELVEDVITVHNTGEPLDVKDCQQFHVVLWKQASLAYDRSEFEKALKWYNYSLSLFPAQSSKDKNIAKLQRNRTSCFLHLKNYEAAKEAIGAAKSHDPQSPQVHFLAFKLALFTGQQDESVKCLNALIGSKSDEDDIKVVTGLISLAAQIAFEQSSRDLAVIALEKLIETEESGAQVFTAIRCLLRIKLTIMDATPTDKLPSLRSMLQHLHRAQSLLPNVASSLQQNEANWLLKVAWNLALQCTTHHKEMAEFFLICYHLSSHLPSDASVLRRQKSCQLMAAAAYVQVARTALSKEDKETSMKAVLDCVSKCRTSNQLLGANDFKDPSLSLLALYEFEATLLLNPSELSSALERVSCVPSVEAKTFETVAALCVLQHTSELSHEVGMKALEEAVRIYAESPEVDGERLSRCYHSLLQMVEPKEKVAEKGEEGQAWSIFNRILDLLESKGKNKFPEIEIVWYLSKAWNCGIHLYSSLKFKAAEQWCSLAMRFLKFLTQHKASYEGQMSKTYTEVLQKLHSGHQFV